MIKVKKNFIDRETGETLRVGDLYTGTPERIEELRDSGHLNKTEATPEPEPKGKPAKAE